MLVFYIILILDSREIFLLWLMLSELFNLKLWYILQHLYVVEILNELIREYFLILVKVEIDEYQNYEKALDALTEAAKCLSKAKDSSAGDQEVRVGDLHNKISLIKKFVHARR